MFTQIVQYFYPDMKKEEIKKFGILALTFFFTIGAYWAIRLLKDVIFFKLAFPAELGWHPEQGRLFQPLAKMLSVGVVICFVLIYSKLVDLFEKHKLFYIICTFYTAIFVSVAGALYIQSLPQYGSAFLGKNLLAGLGWVSYFAIESFGSIVVALFWSFCASVVTSDAAKRGYPFIIMFGQVGAIIGAGMTMYIDTYAMLALATFSVVAIMFAIKYFMTLPAQERIGNREAHATEKVKEGFFEGFFSGLRLLFTRTYLLGILAVSTLYEVINTIVDYQMKSQASLHPVYGTTKGFQQFLAIYGLATNGLAFLMALLGTRYIIKKYGLTVALLFFPVCLGIALIILYGYFAGWIMAKPNATQLLWGTFGVMMLAKGLSYAVSNPTKEMMYIPTSKDAKFKSKGWIDMFGGRSAKALGAKISDPFKAHLADLMVYGTVIGLGLVGVWFLAALYVGRKNAQLTRDGKIIE